jgi:bifunctional UDP-N-acetylglucosamine pyrophosphorylase / glucosamine-1-phosphate N-acetyltransferase
MSRPDTVVVLAAGQGKRMQSEGAKVLQPLCGRPMLAWVLDQALALEPKRILVVVGHAADEVREAIAKLGLGGRVQSVLQEPQRGTGHALQCCLPSLGADPGLVVVLSGDMPLLSAASLQRLLAAQAATADAESERGASLLTATPADPRGFGRVVRKGPIETAMGKRAEGKTAEGTGAVVGILEEKDATPEVRAIREVNLGVYAFRGADLARLLPELKSNNAQGEFYLTDLVSKLVASKRRVEAVVLEDEREAIGVNTLAHLAEARQELQMRILEQHMARGVSIEDPDTTYIDHGVEIGAGTRILPCTVIRAGVAIGKHCEVGPFTHLRAGTVLEDGAEMGSFTEAKQSRLGAGSKAKHLAYLGDARIGKGVNIGAGTIFANYDGRAKHESRVADRCFVGSGTIIVAPATIGEGATTGAGAVVTRQSEVPPGETWVGVPARPLKKKPSGS